MNPFVDPNERIEIVIRYVKQDNGSISIVHRNIAGSHILSTSWKRMNYEQLTAFTSESLRILENGEAVLDWVKHRAVVMQNCMVSWDIEGIPCTPENIARLDPEIAGELIEQYMQATIPDREPVQTPPKDTDWEVRLCNVESLVTQLMDKFGEILNRKKPNK